MACPTPSGTPSTAQPAATSTSTPGIPPSTADPTSGLRDLNQLGRLRAARADDHSAGRRGERPGWNSGRYGFMRRVLEGEIAGALYRRRQVMIEPVFADTKFNRRIDRFLRRGRSAARSEWRLITASGNLL